MKKLLNFGFLGLLIFILLLSCKKDKPDNNDNNNNDTLGVVTVTGNIVIPNGLNSVGTWVVNSGFDESAILNNQYTLDVKENDFCIQFVSDDTGKDILLGYCYPGQTNYDISSSSTIVALLMQAPSVLSLTSQGKIDLINSIKSDPNFSNTISELESRLISGKDLFDTTDIQFYNSLSSLFSSASQRTNTVTSENVTIMRSGKTLLFQNPGKPFCQVIGIYKNNQRIKKIELERYQFFVSSISEAITASYNPVDPIEDTYMMNSDGEYIIKMRTGNLLGDVEDFEALTLNIKNLGIDYIGSVIKILPFNINNPCIQEIRTWAGGTASTIANGNSGSIDGRNFTRMMLELSISTVEFIKSSQECFGNNEALNFFEKTKKLLKFLKAYNVIGTTMNLFNTGVFLYQWQNSPSRVDTCFSVNGNNVGPCNTFTDQRDGNVYQLVTIGSQTWFAENLRYNAAGSWYNTNNPDPKYGRLYDWNTVLTACPAGWHLPTDAEWNTMEMALGLSASDANLIQFRGTHGTAMKSTTGWGYGNGTNSSGFNAFPAGGYYSGSYFDLGGNAFFWSASEYDATYAWFRYLFDGDAGVARSYLYKSYGFSCRCLQD
jgi:uncharacterized protein (TIGR02145 family)